MLARASSNQQELSSGSAHSHRQIVTSQEPRAAIVPTEQRGSGEVCVCVCVMCECVM